MQYLSGTPLTKHSLKVVRTERLLLRPLDEGDALALHAAFQDAEVMRFWSSAPHQDLAETQDWLAANLEHREREFAIVLAGKVIGRVGFWNGEEIGFLLQREHWGHGYAEEALRAACGYAFDVLGMESILADVDPRNERCLRLLERLGFQQTACARRTLFVNGEWCDSVYLRLARPAHATAAAAAGQLYG